MEITTAKYREKRLPDTNEVISKNVIATIDGQEMTVPMDTDNRHYAAILEWVADGNTIADAD